MARRTAQDIAREVAETERALSTAPEGRVFILRTRLRDLRRDQLRAELSEQRNRAKGRWKAPA